tara:strand:- start:309 stop:503 length:195 start_codon:yes stop_codon:yes gene_type:complete
LEINFIRQGDRLWVLKRKVRKSNFSDMSYVKGFLEWIGCDHVLQDKDHYLFVNSVDDIEYEVIA